MGWSTPLLGFRLWYHKKLSLLISTKTLELSCYLSNLSSHKYMIQTRQTQLILRYFEKRYVEIFKMNWEKLWLIQAATRILTSYEQRRYENTQLVCRPLLIRF